MDAENIDKFNQILNYLDKAFFFTGHSLFKNIFSVFPLNTWRWFTVTLTVTSLFGSWTYVHDKLSDLVLVVECFVIFICEVQALLRNLTFDFIRPRVVEYFQRAKDFRSTKVQTRSEKIILKKYNKIEYLIFAGYFSIGTACAVAISVTPLFSEADLPAPLRIPFIPYEGFPYYQLNYAQQIIAASQGIFIITAFDYAFALLIMESCMQLDVIQEKLMCDTEEHNDEGSGDPQEHLRILHEIHVSHLETLRFIKDMCGTFSNIVLVQCVLSTAGITALIFMLSQESEARMYDYLIFSCYITQLLFLCLYCDFLSSRVNSVVSQLYHFPWLRLSPSGRKSLVIMMSCCQKEFFIKAGEWFDLNLPMFVTIMKTAYSYYTVMKDSSH